MNTVPSTTVRSNPKPVTTGGARTIRVFDGETWQDIPCPTNTAGRFNRREAFAHMRRVVIAANEVLTEEMNR